MILHSLNSRHVDFDLDNAGVDTEDRGTKRFIKHEFYRAWMLFQDLDLVQTHGDEGRPSDKSALSSTLRFVVFNER
jgi:hypothetical protein